MEIQVRKRNLKRHCTNVHTIKVMIINLTTSSSGRIRKLFSLKVLYDGAHQICYSAVSLFGKKQNKYQTDSQ